MRTGNMATDWQQKCRAISSRVATLPVLPGKNSAHVKNTTVTCSPSARCTVFRLHGYLLKSGNTGNTGNTYVIAPEYAECVWQQTGNTGNTCEVHT